MRVTPIGTTQFHDIAAAHATGYKWTSHAGTSAELLAEFAGRACYQSWARPNPATATVAGYHANIIDHGHFSIFEHASVSFYVTGCSRALTHELVRHRHLSYSQLSQRFVDSSDVDFVVPPALLGILDAEARDAALEALDAAETTALENYETLVDILSQQGLPHKQVREAARAVLPNSTETRLVVSGNHRAWRDLLTKRWSTHADAEIREFAGLVLYAMRRIAPSLYQDIPEEPFQ